LFAAVLLSVAHVAVAAEGPYGGTPAPIPGTVQAENYDTGGQGVAYNVTSINGAGTAIAPMASIWKARPTRAVDMTSDGRRAGNGFRYTVNAATAGTYQVTFRVAAFNAVTDAFHISNSSGTNLTGSVNVPATGAWQTWSSVTVSVNLPAGQQTLTFNQDNAGWNLNYTAFASTEGPFGERPRQFRARCKRKTTIWAVRESPTT
jgi:hypothetical protein